MLVYNHLILQQHLQNRKHPVFRGVREPHGPAFRGLGSALLSLVKGGSGKALVDHGGTNLMECLPRVYGISSIKEQEIYLKNKKKKKVH